MSKFYYKLYGLNIESEVECKELIKSEKSDDDIKVYFGKAPDEVYDLIKQGCIGYSTENIMWMYVKDIAIYYVFNGKNIIIEKQQENVDVKDIKAYLLGTALGMILIQRNIIAIHGGTILVDNKAIAIVGDCGAGKSTLTSALRIKGYPFMADDVSVLNGNKVNFSYPQQKLCKDAMKKLGYNLKNYNMIDDDREKYVIPVKDNFVMNLNELKAIFEISITDENEDVSCEEIVGGEKLNIFMKNIYRIEVAKIAGIKPIYFKKCLDIVNSIHLYRIKRPDGKFSVSKQIKLVEEVMKSI